MWDFKKKKCFKWYIVLHINFFIYAVSSLLIKKSSSFPFLSFDFIIAFSSAIVCMFLYAIVWQQVIKHMSLIMAYASRGAIVLWGVLFGFFFYKEKITYRQILSIFLIIIGIILFVMADYTCEEERND